MDSSEPAILTLTELPEAVAKRGIHALDVCHFHFQSTSEAYLQQLKLAFDRAGVTFYTLLVDYGDITNPDPVKRSSDIANMKRWIDIAAKVGAERVRVVGGEASPSDTGALALSAAVLSDLIDFGGQRRVRVITENFKSLTSTSENCLYLREACQNRLGLIADFGNFKSDQKYNQLAQILPFSENIHAKGHYDSNGEPDIAEFERCLDLLQAANYDGPIAMVYDGPGDEWEGIARVQAVIEKYL